MTKGASDQRAPAARGRAGRRIEWLRTMATGLVLCGALFGVGCFGQKPSGEGAPSTAPQAPPPPPPNPTAISSTPAPEKKGGAPLLQPPPAAPAESGASGAVQSAPVRAGAANAARKARAPSASEAPKASADREESIAGEPTQPEALRRRLDRAYGAQSADCPSARDRKKAVCDLATQICSLTDRDPDVASVAEYCDDARRRCSEAERRTEERCPS
jgi:hypothetical protein